MPIQLMAQVDSNLAAIAGRQAPFITSLALNRTAVGARDLVRDNLPTRFKLRNRWTMGGIQARTSNKSNLMAAVVAPDYMAIQETGGTRTPQTTRMLAAPADASKSNQVTPRGKRPRAVLADKAFIVDMGGDAAGVFIRYGKKRGQIRLLWWLDTEQKYDSRFEFERDVNDYVQDRFSSHFLAAWAEVIGDGGYAQTGRRGRKRIDRPQGMSARAYRRQQSRQQQ